jgi:hypothetical protein
MGKVVLAIVLLGCLTFTAVVLADPPEKAEGRYRARLSGFEEVPAVLAAGSGEVVASIDSERAVLRLTVKYSDLTEKPAAVTLHVGQRGVAGLPVAYLCGGSGASAKACPAAHTGFEVTLGAKDVVAAPGQGVEAGKLGPVMQALDAGLLYANVITARYPLGEIRGQLIR